MNPSTLVTAPGSVAIADPRTDPRWRRLALTPQGSLFTSPPWIDAVCGTYGFTPQCRIALDGAGDPAAGLAWVPVSDLRGDRTLSLPFSDRADPIVEEHDTWGRLVDGVVGPRAPFTLRCFDTGVPARDPAFRTVGSAAWHGTPLDTGVEEMHARIDKRARRNIGISRREGVRVEATTGLDGVQQFHALHVQLRKHKYRLLAQPVELFERIWDAFTADDAVVTMLAYAGERVIAGAVFLVWNDVLYYKFGASLQEHLALRPNEAIFWAGIRWGIERGLTLLDWGLSDLDQPGLIAYKRRWAAEERRIATLRRGGEAARVSPENGALLGEVTRLLTGPTVPDDVTARAGALLYRYFC